MNKSLLKKSALAVMLLAIMSCGKDDEPTIIDNNTVIDNTINPPVVVNTVPTISAQSFTASENIVDTDIIGTVIATDADTDALSFSIKANSSDLFKISASGEISLANTKTLDYETATSHTLSIDVSDGTDIANAEITITVTDIIENAFVFIYNVEGLEQLIIDINTNFTNQYNYTVYWGDGTSDTNQTGSSNHDYSSTDGITEYTVSITGDFPAKGEIHTGNFAHGYLVSIENWGGIKWETMDHFFENSKIKNDFKINALDAPDLSLVTDLSFMFTNTEITDATEVINNMNTWDFSTITNMGGMFSGASLFNGDLSNWDVSNVTNMTGMFSGASSFNGDISNWNVINVTSMGGMFNNATNFNQDLSNWSTQHVVDCGFFATGSGLINAHLPTLGCFN